MVINFKLLPIYFIGIRKNIDMHRKLAHKSYDFRDIIA